MVEKAQRHAEEDKARLEEAEARNKADSLVYQTEKTLKEHGEKLPESDRKAVEDALKELKEALEGSDISRIKSGTEVLTQASYRLAEHMYKDAGAPGAAEAGEAGAAAAAAGAAGGETTDDSDVVDAEFTEVKDEDK
jgi:molecular chaperone DnaK